MRRTKGLDAGLGQVMADLYTRSPGAAAVAAMARHLGLGEVRLAGTTPYLTYVVDAPHGPSLEALAAYATVALETGVTVLSLGTLPAWRRAVVWAAAPVVPAPPADRAPGAAPIADVAADAPSSATPPSRSQSDHSPPDVGGRRTAAEGTE